LFCNLVVVILDLCLLALVYVGYLTVVSRLFYGNNMLENLDFSYRFVSIIFFWTTTMVDVYDTAMFH